MSETTSEQPPSEHEPAEHPPQESDAVAAPSVEPTTAPSGTPIAVMLLYVLGLIAATVLFGSLVFVGLAYAASGGGGFGVNVSVRAFVIWIGLIVAAGGTYVWRRWGRS
jgi:hypothetical protein